MDLIPFNPFDRESTHVAMDGVKGHPDLTNEQITALIDACPSSTWRSTVALCIYAGLRIGETFIVQWDDVAWGNGKLLVTSEKQTGGKSRQRPVKMEQELEQVLLEGFEAGDS
ncbi:MAG: tyrosine-type recombinase/integrase [Phycisphaeraceae bacterium]|nr:tyrosine-type recombinase/integrase [Phycisphaeraceae bacterium]